MSKTCSQIIITTLGGFDVFKNNASLTAMHPGSKKIWELFKFMLTHRTRSFTPETLMESLWPSEDYSDPRGTLRRQMHRLRQILEESGSVDQCGNLIIFTNGYYRWNSDADIVIDSEIFEKKVQQADLLKQSNPKGSLSHYLEAIELYQGEYLPDCTEHQWVFSVRNLYRRLFLKAVISAGELVGTSNDFNMLLPICEKAIQLDYYEEDFHLLYMETLMRIGEKKTALQHYEQVTGFFYHEMGVKPSSAFKSIYKKILATQEVHQSIDTLHTELESDESSESAFYCEPIIFRSIYDLEKRRSERSGYQTVISLITVGDLESSYSATSESDLKMFTKHLTHSLRKGDVVTRWNEKQLLVLLPGLTEETMKKVLSRVLLAYSQRQDGSKPTIRHELRQILPPQKPNISSMQAEAAGKTSKFTDA